MPEESRKRYSVSVAISVSVYDEAKPYQSTTLTHITRTEKDLDYGPDIEEAVETLTGDASMGVSGSLGFIPPEKTAS